MIAACLLALLWIQTPAGASIDISPFRYSREIPAAPAGLSTIPLDAAVLAHSRLDLADLRIVDSTNHQIPYLLEKRDDVLSVPLKLISTETDVPPPKHSYYRMVLPFENLPAARLTFTTTDRVFQRSIQLKVKRAPDGRSEPFWEHIAEVTWINAESSTTASPLTLDVRAGLGTAEVIVDVEEGDNRPLALSDCRLELPAYQLRFFYPQGETLTLLYGQEGLSAPRYDLELLAPRVTRESSYELTLGEEHAASIPEESETSKAVLWIALIIVVVSVLGMLIRLLRASPAGTNPD